MKNKDRKVNEIYKTADIYELISKKYTKNINEIHSSNLTLGDRIADRLSDFAGSWTFIITFFIIILSWIILNSIFLFMRPFDPYPFILLNLLLSCLAAIQAPVIMMSQNRQEAKDRLRAEHDYEINLKTEIVVEEILKRLNEIEKKQDGIKNNLSKYLDTGNQERENG